MAGSAPLKFQLRKKFKNGIRRNANIAFSKVTPTASPGQVDLNSEMGNKGSTGLPGIKREPVKMN